MHMSTVPKPYITSDAYLRLERAADFKSEYYRGEIFAMSGASREHNLITGNVFASCHSQFRDRHCEVYQGDMRVKVRTSGLYTYPDVVVTCEEPRFEDDVTDTLLNPQVIIEVLSDSTEKYDRGKKFEHYRQIESLMQYFLIAQDRVHLEKYTRQENGQWLLWETSAFDDKVLIEAVKCELEMAEIYARIKFDE